MGWLLVILIGFIGVYWTAKFTSWEFYGFAIGSAVLSLGLVVLTGIIFNLPWV